MGGALHPVLLQRLHGLGVCGCVAIFWTCYKVGLWAEQPKVDKMSEKKKVLSAPWVAKVQTGVKKSHH